MTLTNAEKQRRYRERKKARGLIEVRVFAASEADAAKLRQLAAEFLRLQGAAVSPEGREGS